MLGFELFYKFLALLTALPAIAAPAAHALGGGVYAYISDNDASSNSVFLVGETGILVVDTGFDDVEAGKLLAAIRAVSPLPVRYIINTHYHRDHQAGNGIVGPDAQVVSTPFTRERTMEMLKHPPPSVHYRPATITIATEGDIYLDGQQVHVAFSGPAHTMGDLVVSFPAQGVVATGDLFMNHSAPAMDRGSVLNWIHTLEQILATRAEVFVPGHFEIGSRADLQRFHDYLADLRDQVSAQIARGQPLDPRRYSDFRQFPKFHATFADNAAVVDQELRSGK